MKLLERSQTPDGITIQLEDWTDKNTPDCPDLYGIEIGAYPVAVRSSSTGWIRAGEQFRLSISENKYRDYGAEDVRNDYEALKNGSKTIKDLAAYFYNGEKDKYLLGMPSMYPENMDRRKIWN